MSTRRVDLDGGIAYLSVLDVEFVAHILVLRPLVDLCPPC
jgi:hypothetical protein